MFIRASSTSAAKSTASNRQGKAKPENPSIRQNHNRIPAFTSCDARFQKQSCTQLNQTQSKILLMPLPHTALLSRPDSRANALSKSHRVNGAKNNKLNLPSSRCKKNFRDWLSSMRPRSATHRRSVGYR